MKKLIASSVLTLSLVNVAFAGPIGRVAAVNGTAWVISAGKKAPLAVGSELSQGDEVDTGAHSSIILVLGHDVASLVKENSRARIEETSGKDWVMDLAHGAVLSHVENPEKRPDHFRVRTPQATMGVRGTTFFVEQEEKTDHTYLCPCMGRIAVSSPDGKSTTELSGKHHDFPKKILAGSGPIESRLEAAPCHDHTDAEAAEVVAALKR